MGVPARLAVAPLCGLASLLVACGTEEASAPQALPSPVVGSVAELLGVPETPFEASYVWRGDVPDGLEGHLIWREREGVRRWDAWLETDRGTSAGVFAVMQVGGSDHYSAYYECSWLAFPTSRNVQVSCDEGGFPQPLIHALKQALDAPIVRENPTTRVFLGLEASCFNFADLRGEGEICARGGRGALYFRGLGSFASVGWQEIEIAAYSTDITPFEAALSSFTEPRTVSVSELSLPEVVVTALSKAGYKE